MFEAILFFLQEKNTKWHQHDSSKGICPVRASYLECWAGKKPAKMMIAAVFEAIQH